MIAESIFSQTFDGKPPVIGMPVSWPVDGEDWPGRIIAAIRIGCYFDGKKTWYDRWWIQAELREPVRPTIWCESQYGQPYCCCGNCGG